MIGVNTLSAVVIILQEFASKNDEKLLYNLFCAC